MERNAKPAEGGTFRVRYIVYAALAVLALMAVFSYSPEDAASLSGGSTRPPTNWIGYTGAWIGFWSFHLFGLATYMIVLLMVLRTIRRFLPARPLRFWKPFAGGVLAVMGVMLLLALTPEPFAGMTDRLGIGRKEVPQLALSGGVIGQWLAAPAVYPTDGANADEIAAPHPPDGFAVCSGVGSVPAVSSVVSIVATVSDGVMAAVVGSGAEVAAVVSAVASDAVVDSGAGGA